MPGPWEKYQTQGPVTMGAPDPMKVNAERRAENADNRAMTTLQQSIASQNQQRALDRDKFNYQQSQDAIKNQRTVLGTEDAQAIAKARADTADLPDVIRTIRSALSASSRLGTGPMRATALSAVIPEENGGFMDKVGGLFSGVTDPQTRTDWQTLRSLQSQGVLAEQRRQAGPQTEGDAARMKMAGVTPWNYQGANENVGGAALLSALIAQRRPDFMSQWAAKYGSLAATGRNGQTFDKFWRDFANDAQARYDAARSKPAQSKAKSKYDGFEVLED